MYSNDLYFALNIIFGCSFLTYTQLIDINGFALFYA